MKKRILAVLLAFCMLLSIVSCASESQIAETKPTKEETKTEEEIVAEEVPQTSKKPTNQKDPQNPNKFTDPEETKKPDETTKEPDQSTDKIPYWQGSGTQDGPITLPAGFSVGYSRKDMSPKEPVLTYDGAVTNQIYDPVQITCVSVSDGEEVALFYSLDLRQSFPKLVEDSMAIIQQEFAGFGIEKDSMFFTATHNHSSPDAGSPNAAGVAAWRKIYFQRLREVTEDSLRDLAPAEAFVGKSNTKDISFVRRFVTADGKVTTDSTLNVVGYESQPDTELRTIRFDRGNKKDVLMVNYQIHYGVATRYFGDVVSADFIHDFRQAAEGQLGVHFAYYQGAAGCTTFSAMKSSDRVYKTYMDAIPAFMTAVRQALSLETRAQTGKIQKAMTTHAGTVRKDDAATVALARSIYNEKDPAKQKALLAQQSTFINAKAAENCVYRNVTLGATVSMPFTAISFGDIAFCSAPYEMFHQNGIQIREKSPFQMTFVCCYTNGSNSYVPAWECTESGSQYDVKDCYENYASRFVDGSGEEFKDVILGLLNRCR